MHERRFPPSQANRLDDPERRNWLPPDEVVSRLALQPGWTVADIGAGTGYFTLPMAEAVGAHGRVFAVDVAPEMLERIRAKIAGASLHNVQLMAGEASATGIAPQSCDCLFLANVWHEFDDRAAVLTEATRVLKGNGRIAILDWRPDVEPNHGPPLDHRISEEAATDALLTAGFCPDAQSQVGRYSWLVLGTKRSARD
ncbi:MAG: methyltransferase domain-containing protein [Acidobacteriaceae bacterium]